MHEEWRAAELIALTSCKLFVRTINRRRVLLGVQLSSRELPLASRWGNPTSDQLVGLESHIKGAFIRKQFSVTVLFFYLKKAYDTAWRYDILSDLKSFGLSGNMLSTQDSYVPQRSFSVRGLVHLSQVFTCRKM